MSDKVPPWEETDDELLESIRELREKDWVENIKESLLHRRRELRRIIARADDVSIEAVNKRNERSHVSTESDRIRERAEASEFTGYGELDEVAHRITRAEDFSRDFEEESKLQSGAERLRQIDALQPENWKQLDGYGRRVTLDRAGQALSEVYDHPRPPLLGSDFRDESTLGVYDDERYAMFLKGRGEFDLQELGGDDPKHALRIYAHEFRHCYQWEQASRCDSPQLFKRMAVDDPDRARQWASNIHDYTFPPTQDLAEKDPARYLQDFKTYKNQPVERDAELFADELVKRVFSGR